MLCHGLEFTGIEVHAAAACALINHHATQRNFLHLVAALWAAHPMRCLLSACLRCGAAGIKPGAHGLQDLLILLVELAVGFVVSG
ncbi:MAG: hypothetical protein RIR77_1885 [Planctomycetota bacterium]